MSPSDGVSEISLLTDRTQARPFVALIFKMALLILIVILTDGSVRGADSEYPTRPITMICPWAAGGGTDRVSRQLAMLLEQRLGQPVSVINATGGKGVTGHNRGLSARPDGYTIAMITFELNTMHWAGLTTLTYADCIPLFSVNEDYAALFVRGDSSWNNLAEIEAAIAADPKQLTASGTAVGGAWHLALAGWLASAGRNAGDVKWIPSEGANPSMQQLMSGGVDMVCCSLPEARVLLESGDVRAIGVMSEKRAVGFEEVPTFSEQGRPWTLGGWRGLAVPLNTPPAIVQRLTDEIQEIVGQDAVAGSFAEFMQTQKFDHTWRGPDAFVSFLADNDRKLGELLRSEVMKSISKDRFSPMTFPYVLFGLIGASLFGLFVNSRRVASASQAIDPQAPTQIPADATIAEGGYINFAMVLLSIVGYVVFAETVGFILVTSLILLLLMIRLGNRWLTSLLIVSVFVPVMYLVFAYGLRVPLPRGWLG